MHDTCHKGVRCPCNIVASTLKNGEADLLHRFAWQPYRIFASGYVCIACKIDKEYGGGT